MSKRTAALIGAATYVLFFVGGLVGVMLEGVYQ